jgi:Curli production assembly/transport component CsgG
VSFSPVTPSSVALEERPSLAVLPFGIEVHITKLSSIKSVEGSPPKEDEARAVAAAVREVEEEARWLMVSRLATAQGFRVVPSEAADAVAAELGIQRGQVPAAEEVREFGRRLGADLVVAGSILDYGKVRWTWSAAGMLADLTWETVVIGLATSWNPAIILGNVGFELLTSTPLWFGGAYVLGVSFRPVRVEVRAFETVEGYPIWQTIEESAYAWGALKDLPEEIRKKKESQLILNLAEIMETLADELTEQTWTAASAATHP